MGVNIAYSVPFPAKDLRRLQPLSAPVDSGIRLFLTSPSKRPMANNQ